ncbi:MAG TPA: IclR family transcriptional regulator [Cellulomonas sp.]
MAGVNLVHKTLSVLTYVAGSPEGIRLSDVARGCGIPKATCFRILNTLEEDGWLVSDPSSRKFRIALKPTLMFQQYATPRSAAAFVRTTLERIAETTGETAGIDQLVGTSVFVLAEAHGPHLITHGRRQVPRILPAWRTSTGKTLMAFGADALPGRDLVESSLAEDPSPVVATYEDFLREIERARDHGFATAYDELEPGSAAVSVPVRTGDHATYALWVGGPSFRVSRDDLVSIAELLKPQAVELGRLLEQAGDRSEIFGAMPHY